MPYLIFGDDTYRSRQKLNAIKAKYVDTNLGDTNLAVLDGATAKAEEIIRQLWAMPFLSPKRLVVINNLLSEGNKDTQGAIVDFLPKIPATTISIFYEEGAPGKRNALFRKLNQPKLAEEFMALPGPSLLKWINQRCQALGTAISADAASLLAQIVGSNLWRMDQEINKLTLYSPSGITAQAVREVIHSDPSGDIWQCLDALATRNAAAALNHLRGRIALGDAPPYLLSMINYGFRTLITIQDLHKRSPHQTGSSGIHPFVWRKSLAQLKHFSRSNLNHIYRYLRNLDYDAKTGIIEPLIALDLFVFELCYGALKEGKDGDLASS